MTPQAAVILGDLRLHEDLFDMTRDGLGDGLLDAAADGMARNLGSGLDADGAPFKPLSPSYAQWKGQRFPGQQIGHLYGLLKDPANLAGDRLIGVDLAVSVYGVSAEARAEAANFSDGGREFHGLTAEAVKASDDLLDDRFDEVS